MLQKGRIVDKQKQLAPEKALEIKEVVAITANVCEEKNDCGRCDRGGFYGLPLPFILHHADKSILSVCYKCAAKAARKADCKLPKTEADIFRAIEVEDFKKNEEEEIKNGRSKRTEKKVYDTSSREEDA